MAKSIIKQPKKKLSSKVKLDLGEKDLKGEYVNAICTRCGKVKNKSDFYKSSSPNNTTGITCLCKSCIQQMSTMGTGEFSKRGLFDICKTLDKPYKSDLYEKVKNKSNLLERARVGEYIRLLNQGNMKNLTFKDGESEVVEPISIPSLNNTADTEGTAQATVTRKEFIDLFGGGYTDEEYYAIYKRYMELKNNYPLKTAMHKEALIKYCKYSVKEDFAVASGDTASAKTWGELAAKTATAAKINPSQLSAADLSDGMTCFSQLSAVVEKAQDIIPLLPQFVEKPKDRVDYTLWEYINYIQHLNGKPLVEYKDIYKFLQVRYDKLKEHLAFLKKENDGKFDEHDIDSEV